MVDTDQIDKATKHLISVLSDNEWDRAKQDEAIKVVLDSIGQYQLMIKQLGGHKPCDACGADMWFIVTKNGKRAPYTLDGLNHFANCPNAQDFRKKAKQ